MSGLDGLKVSLNRCAGRVYALQIDVNACESWIDGTLARLNGWGE